MKKAHWLIWLLEEVIDMKPWLTAACINLVTPVDVPQNEQPKHLQIEN